MAVRPNEPEEPEVTEEQASAQPAQPEQAEAAEEPTAGAEPDEAEGAGGGSEVEDLQAALAHAQRTAEEYLDHLRRERAEFENFRRRSTKERMEALDRGAEQLTGNLLGVLDNFGFTLQAAERSSDDQLAKGIQLVHAELMKVLTEAGLEEVPGVGEPFDPTVHEAVERVEAREALGEDVDEPVVAEVLRSGYRFKGRLLRPATVKVAE